MKERSHLNGMGYVYYYSKDILEPSRVAEMMKRLNIQSVRSWNHIPWVLKDEKNVNIDIADGFHRMYDELLKAGVSQLVGMSHYWFYPSRLGIAGETSGIPLPSQQKESDYQDFLDIYEQSWYTLVKEFPEVTDWETGNEYNHKEFLRPLDSAKEMYTLKERADICTDLMFRSARAIHSISDTTGIIMPGMAPIGERGTGVYATNIEVEYDGIIMTLEKIYENIKSGQFGSTNPRDFFDSICWHPYFASQDSEGRWSWKVPDDNWVALNQSVYDVAVKAGDDGVGCCLSEFGFSDGGSQKADSELCEHISEGFRLIKEKMPFVDTVHAYRFFDSMGYVTQEPDTYSFFTMENGKLVGKQRAYALQKQYGGNGELVERFDNNEKEMAP